MDALGIGQYRVYNDGNRPLTPREQGYPNLSLFNIGDSGSFNNPDRHEIGNHITWVKGRHNLKFGFEWNHIRMYDTGGNLPTGRVIWSANESGLNLASFLMGVPSTTETAEGNPLTVPVAARWGTYINDDYKIHPRLTLNFGLRFDYSGNPRDSKGLWRTLNFPGEGRGTGYINPATGQAIPTMGPEFVDERGSVKLWKQDLRFFMPRVGIAFRPTDKWDPDGRRLVLEPDALERVHHSQPESAEIRQPAVPAVDGCRADHSYRGRGRHKLQRPSSPDPAHQ